MHVSSPHRLGAALPLLLCCALAGCGPSTFPRPAGSNIPTVSPNSVALPGANDAADAPRAPSVAESQDATLTSYRDPATGVSFRYPTVWRPAVGHTLPVPEFSEVAGAPRLTQEFRPGGTYYAPTVLRGLTFSYTVVPGRTQAACDALPGGIAASTGKPTPVTYHGVRYSEAHGSDAGMCTEVQATLDSTLQGTNCLMFERDFVTSCPYVKSKTLPRPLTQQETAALQRHLDAVMQSVTLTPPR